MTARTPTFVLGGTGYVAGELIRLVAGHPQLQLAGVMSDSQPGEPIAKAFPHLAPSLGALAFLSQEAIGAAIAKQPASAIFSAAPHGVSAGLIDSLLTRAAAAGAKPRVVDISADFRYSTVTAYEKVYKHVHGAPSRIAEFTCAVPEHLNTLTTTHVGHPGCFATATLLASVPLLALNLVEPRLFVAGVTGSTGSGRKPVEGTHHPTRHSDLYSYNALGHRHVPEVIACALAASGVEADFAFVPHSGPFARGIHVTVQGRAQRPIKTPELLDALREFYKGRPFVRVAAEMPHIKDVAGSNYAFISGAANGSTIAVMCVIDNLVKGAAGGAMQWLNRLFGFEETTGLLAPATGWT